jgi:hypothetical protein
MKCSNCYKEINYPLDDSHKRFLAIFIEDTFELSSFNTTKDIFENSNSDIFAKRIFETVLRSNDIGTRIEGFYGDELRFNMVCPHCAKETKDSFWNYNRNTIYEKLLAIQKEYIYEKLSTISSMSRENLENIYGKENGDAYYAYIAQKTIEKFDLTEAEKLKKLGEVIEKFHYVGKGGEGEFLTYILGLVSATIIPNIIYDLIKWGGKKIYVWLKIKKDTQGTKIFIDEQIKNNYPEYYEVYSYNSVLRYLSKKQRKKIVKKIINQRIKEKTKVMKKARKKENK